VLYVLRCLTESFLLLLRRLASLAELWFNLPWLVLELALDLLLGLLLVDCWNADWMEILFRCTTFLVWLEQLLLIHAIVVHLKSLLATSTTIATVRIVIMTLMIHVAIVSSRVRLSVTASYRTAWLLIAILTIIRHHLVELRLSHSGTGTRTRGHFPLSLTNHVERDRLKSVKPLGLPEKGLGAQRRHGRSGTYRP